MRGKSKHVDISQALRDSAGQKKHFFYYESTKHIQVINKNTTQSN